MLCYRSRSKDRKKENDAVIDRSMRYNARSAFLRSRKRTNVAVIDEPFVRAHTPGSGSERWNHLRCDAVSIVGSLPSRCRICAMSTGDNKWLSCVMPSSNDDPCIMPNNLNSSREPSVNRIANIMGKRFHSAFALILSIVGRVFSEHCARARSLRIAIQWPVSSMLDSSSSLMDVSCYY